MKKKIRLIVNGEEKVLTIDVQQTLLEVLREDLGLTGTKKGCNQGECGACTVLLEGKPVSSCSLLAVKADGKAVTTIEGLAKGGQLHPIQQAFNEKGAIQCGFCSPGMILVTKSLLEQNPNPTTAEIKEAIAGNICRCTGYVQIIEAIRSLVP
ncbi:MAG: (2Fe-2S)-binding protein [Firmicutes bacterium]|jgi:carbon-monoxide dehydrogenase small subunit|nr:(2Fe-2S)-binding protein [Bacillota bacterium]